MGIWLPHGFSLNEGFCRGIIINALQIAHSLSPVSLSLFFSLFSICKLCFFLSLCCVNIIILVISQVEINEYMHMHHCIMYYAPPTGHYTIYSIKL